MALLADIDLAALTVLKYPDPRLRAKTAEIARVDEDVARLAERMLELMYQSHGVGLAAPQVGVPIRLFVANPAGAPGPDEAVYVNPRIVDQEGSVLEEEGCLSFPGINTKVKRRKKVTLEALDPRGETFRQTGEGLMSRIFQHELDHLDGVLLVDRMSIVARVSHRWALKELEDKYSK